MSEKQKATEQPKHNINIDEETGKKIMPNDKIGLSGAYLLVDHEGNVKIPKEYFERAGVTMPPNDEWLTEIEIGGADQFMRISTTQCRCENCRANYKTQKYKDGRELCRRCYDDAEFQDRLKLRQQHAKWLLLFELTSTFDEYQEYITVRNTLPPWVREQELLDHEIDLGRILTLDELVKYVKEWEASQSASK
ncbi:hypothetical protein ER45_030615 (plasmid) [Bacillus mycoides]|nr:hypothetical protein ER45_030615 [Bacillus mycoides]